MKLVQKKMSKVIRFLRGLLFRTNEVEGLKPEIVGVPEEMEDEFENDEGYETASEEWSNEILSGNPIPVSCVFPDDIDLVYELPLPRKLRPTLRTSKLHDTDGTPRKLASFPDLPRELRDEIYKYILRSNKICKIHFQPKRKREHLPHLKDCRSLPFYIALPLFRKEILETYYRQNTFRLIATEDYSRRMACEWIQSHAQLLGQIRHLQIGHTMCPNDMHYCWSTGVATFIRLKPDKSIEVTTSYNRPLDGCVCDISKLVHERLAQDDAISDPVCIRSIEESTQYEPILRFALQLLETVRLSEIHQQRLRVLPYGELRKIRTEMATHCHACGGRRWGFQYCSRV